MKTKNTENLMIVVREILDLPKHSDSWDLIQENYSSFISDDDVRYSWENFSQSSGFPELDIEQENLKASWHLSGNKVDLKLLGNREDCFREIICLATLLSPDFELKYCMDTWHSSERAYVILSAEDWLDLDKYYGHEHVCYRFMSMPDSAEAFIEIAFSEENQREY